MAANTEGEVHKFSSTQVALPPDLAKLIAAFAAKIPDHELAEDGREDEPHVTVKYGLHGTDPMSIRKALAGEKHAKLKLRKTALFKSEPEYEVLIIHVDSPDLRRLNSKVEKSGEFTDTHPGYKPHATIAYLKPGKGSKYAGSNEFDGLQAKIPSITFSAKDGKRTEIPLESPMPKKMAFQRKAARQASRMAPPGMEGAANELPDLKIPHEGVTDPSGPGATDALPEIPTAAKQMTAEAPAPDTAAPTAAPPARPPQSPGQAKKLLSDLIRKNPNYRIPGQGAAGRPESFNEFRVRALSSVRGIMQELASNPLQAIAVPKHSQVSNLVQAWIANGMPDDLSVDAKALTASTASKPGEIERFYPDVEGDWKMEKFDPATATSLPNGSIYFVEHGETPTVAAKSGTVSAGQKGRAEIVAAIHAGDWKRALATAKSASAAGLSDDEISEAIDEAIPDAEGAEGLAPHHLLPMASAASPGKRAALMPAVRKKFGEMPGVSPDAAQSLRSHIGRLGPQ